MTARAASPSPRLRVLAVDFGVRPMALRLPFKFGLVTLTRCPQLFVRTTVEVAGRGTHTGWAAELMVPRWFDKRTDRSATDNVGDLAAATRRAGDAYLTAAPSTAFGLFAGHYDGLMADGTAAGATALSTSFGQAVLDRAMLDALCRATGSSLFEAFRRNLPGLDASAAPASMADLADWNWSNWLHGLTVATRIEARHTIGMLDALDERDEPLNDPAALPVSLPAIVRRYGHRWFKIKLGGDVQTDLARLDAVLTVLDSIRPGHRFTLDGNEQYADVDALAALCDGLRRSPRLAARPDALAYIEQPLARDASLDPALRTLDAPAALLLDEGDGTLDAFPAARAHGWHGVSSKGCKGIYKALVNRARCDLWNAGAGQPLHFLSAEDLTCQAGLAVQQDLALAALLGLDHCERNGHHYVDGFGDAPTCEQDAFAAAHPDLYERSAGRPRLSIRDGRIALASLGEAGFAHSADPDFDSLLPLHAAPALAAAST